MADGDVVDQTNDDDDNDIGPLRVHINRPPLSKPSVRHGRGRGGQMRVFTDNAVRREMNAVKELALQARDNHGFTRSQDKKSRQQLIWQLND